LLCGQVVYTLLVYVLLLNLLIAVLSGKIEEIEKNSLLHVSPHVVRSTTSSSSIT